MAGISEGDALDALDSAEAAGLLADVRRGRDAAVRACPGGPAVYAGLPRGRRRRLHAQAAEVLAKQPGAVTIRLAPR